MGYLLIDHRVSSGAIREYNTSCCKHCGAAIIYKSKLIGGAFKRVRITLYGSQEIEEVDQGFYCNPCSGDICKVCGEASTRGGTSGPCVTQQRQIDQILYARR